MSEAELVAWAAGFFEGEGYFTSAWHPRRPHLPPRPMVGILNSDLEMLTRFASVVGVGHISGPRKPRGVSRKPLWTWQASGIRDVRVVLDMMSPWLSDRRRNRGEKVIRDGSSVCEGQAMMEIP